MRTNPAYPNTDMSQSWFVRIDWGEITYGELIVIQGTLRQALAKLHHLSERTGAFCKVFGLKQATISPHAVRDIKLAAETGMLLQEAAVVGRDYDFDSWRSAFSRVIEDLEPDQRLAELQTLNERVAKEIEILQLNQDLNLPLAEENAAVESEKL